MLRRFISASVIFDAFLISGSVERRVDLEAGRRRRDQIDDRSMVREWPPAPVLRDVAELMTQTRDSRVVSNSPKKYHAPGLGSRMRESDGSRLTVRVRKRAIGFRRSPSFRFRTPTPLPADSWCFEPARPPPTPMSVSLLSGISVRRIVLWLLSPALGQTVGEFADQLG
jgi:hypothetical protein